MPSDKESSAGIRYVTRRHALVMAGSFGGLALSGALPGAVAQMRPPIDTLAIGPVFGPSLKPIAEEEAGLAISNGAFQSSVDTVSRLTAPGGARFDMMFSSFDFSRPIIMGAQSGQEKVQALDMSLIPNFQTITEASRYGIGERDGKVYMVPLCWGFDTILFNRDHVPENDPYTQSWSLLFEDKYAGRIAWWDSSLNMLLAAGLYLGHKEPEKMSQSELNEAGKFLISKKKNVRTIFSTFAQGTNLLASGEVVACYGLVTMRTELEQKGFNVGSSWAKEGVLSLIQCGYVPKGAARTEAAHKLINAMLSKRYAAQLTRACGYLSTSSHAAADYSPEDRKRLGFGMFDGTSKHYPQKFPAGMNSWIEVWSRVKSA